MECFMSEQRSEMSVRGRCITAACDIIDSKTGRKYSETCLNLEGCLTVHLPHEII